MAGHVLAQVVGTRHPERRPHMGERAMIIAVTAVVLVLLLVLYIFFMR